MGSGNGGAGVVDLPVMWIHRRLDDDTAVSYRYPLWPYVLSVFIIIGIATSEPMLLIPIGVALAVAAGIWWLVRRAPSDRTEQERRATVAWLEQAQADRDAADLRSKYDR
jgi:uncharacterized membrane protein